MDRDALVAKLMATFLEELADHVRAFDRDLLELERGPGSPRSAELLKTLFRTAHSLKGASRSVGQGVLERACHELEETLGAWQRGALAPSKELFRVLFATIDAIGAVGDALRAGGIPVSIRIEALLPLLASARAGERIELVEDQRMPEVAPASASSRAHRHGEGSIRVSTHKLDELLKESGELIGARRRLLSRLDDIGGLREAILRLREEWRTVAPSISDLARHPERTSLPLTRRSVLVLTRATDHLRNLAHAVERLEGTLERDRHDLEQAAKPLEASVRGVRLLPFAEGCAALERAARDVAEASGKQLELVLDAGDAELDRSVLEALKDPLLHLVHNAVDHGIELPDERRRMGKSPVGRLVVSAAVRAGWVEVTVADDGRGVDLEAIREQARARGLTVGPGDDLVRLLFEPAFSTARKVTRTSGRGVGLDVVKSHVEALRGTIEVSFVPGVGTRFLLRVPHTLLTMRVLFVRASGEDFALPSASVARLMRVSPADVGSVDGREVISSRGDEAFPPIAIVSLAALLELPAAPQVATVSAVVLEVAGRRVALVVDELLDEREVVVKSLGARLSGLTRHHGATLLPTGKMALILNPSTLASEALAASPTCLAAAARTTPRRQRILVVEDSITTRALEKSILEGAGYDVSLAVDGEDALRLLGERAFDLVVADVEMPRLDGLALTSAIRRSPRLRDLPVVLVTGLGDDAAKARGVEAGADAYLVKSGFDQRALLDTIGRLL